MFDLFDETVSTSWLDEMIEDVNTAKNQEPA